MFGHDYGPGFSLGSLCAGSLIIAIVKVIRLLFALFEEKIERLAGKQYTVKVVLKVVACLLWCVEKCLKFLNRNAYIEVAITGGLAESVWGNIIT